MVLVVASSAGFGGLFTALGLNTQAFLLNTVAFLVTAFIVGKWIFPPLTRALDAKKDELKAATRLEQEAGRYGMAGSRPQVVWPNGVLASLAVGLFVQLVCPWHCAPQLAACCEFDGNRHRVETNRFDYAAELQCTHFRSDELGDRFFTRS